jgi:hypothetical protein
MTAPIAAASTGHQQCSQESGTISTKTGIVVRSGWPSGAVLATAISNGRFDECSAGHSPTRSRTGHAFTPLCMRRNVNGWLPSSTQPLPASISRIERARSKGVLT